MQPSVCPSAQIVQPAQVRAIDASWPHRLLRHRRSPTRCSAASVPRPTGCAASPPTRSTNRSRNSVRVGLDGDVDVRRPAPDAPPVGDGLAGRQRAAQLHVHGQRLGPDQRRVERRRDRQRVVDERAVEAVVAAVELHVEAQRVGDEADDRVRATDATPIGRSSAGDSSGWLPARRARRVMCSGRELGPLGHVEARARAAAARRRRAAEQASKHDLRRLRVDSGCSTRSSARCCRATGTRRP